MTENRCAVLSRDAIKYIAVFTMLLNHIANILLEQGTVLFECMVNIGYFTAFVMCSFLVDGYDYTKSKKKYAQRLLLFAAVSELPYCLAFTKDGILEFVGTNMIFTLFICFCLIYVIKEMPDSSKKTALIIFLVLMTAFGDWGLLAPLMVTLFVRGQSSGTEMKKSWGMAILFFGILNVLERLETAGLWAGIGYGIASMIGPTLAGICILYLYDRKKGTCGKPFSKWFFYVFYPAHLLILGMLRICVKN